MDGSAGRFYTLEWMQPVEFGYFEMIKIFFDVDIMVTGSNACLIKYSKQDSIVMFMQGRRMLAGKIIF